MLEFDKQSEIKNYFNEKNNTYEFIVNGDKQNVMFNFDLNIKGRDITAGNIIARDIIARDIIARDIKAWNIKAWNINAGGITAWNINAWDINAGGIDVIDIKYKGVCFAYNSFKCVSVESDRENSKHFCLDSEIVFKKEKNNEKVRS